MTTKYIRKGRGPAVVLQHGFLSGAVYWRSLIDSLADSFDIIATNLPGYADNAAAEPVDRIEKFAEFVLDLVSELGVDRFSLLGHSMGGMIAQEVALQAPERLDKLVLFGTGPNGVIPGRFESIAASRERVINEGAASTITRTVASWFVEESRDANYQSGVDLAGQTSVAAMLAGYTAWENWSSASRLTDIEPETLIIWGERDRSYNWEQVHQLWKNIPSVSLAVLPGCAHNAHLENPELFNLVVKDFLLGGPE